MRIKIVILFILSIIIFSQCKRDFGSPNWDVDILAPIAKTSMNLGNLIPDSIKSLDEDSLIKLVYQKDLYDMNLDSILFMGDESYQLSAYLDSLKLSNITIVESITLGDILTAAGLPNLDGWTLPIGEIPGTPSDPFDIDANEYFETMTLTQGFIDIKIENGLPIDINNLIFELKNASNGDVVAIDTFELIPTGGTVIKTVSLAGKTVEGSLIGQVLNMESPGSNGSAVLIDYDDELTTTFKIYGIVPFSATAVFPEQALLDKVERIIFDMGEVALSEIVFKQAELTIMAYNTLLDPVNFKYHIPGMHLNGDTFNIQTSVDAAVNGQAAEYLEVHDLSGYTLNLQGAGFIEQLHGIDINNNGFIDEDTINTILVLAEMGIDSTGNLIPISLQDSFIFKSFLTDMVPEYAIGFMGRDTFKVEGSDLLDFMQLLNNTSIELEDTKISLELSNQMGLKGGIEINGIRASNTESGDMVELSITSSNNIIIDKPSDPGIIGTPVDPTYASLHLDNTNSNAQDLLEIFPNKIDYDLNIYLNPGINPPAIGFGDDFLYYDSRLKAGLNLEVPLSLIADQLSLVDTAELQLEMKDLENIKSGSLKIITQNQLPLDANIEIALLDENFVKTSNLSFSNNLIAAGILNETTGRVNVPSESVLQVNLSNDDIQNLSATDYLEIKAVFHSQPAGEFVKIYSNYHIDFLITADFNYELGN